ncbi:hypothetical protein NQ314_008003 [Rhamnusium bicolor]|uniref:Uncharacterized protein n=1 Tax=Rhamnusium bicolor TaxID=1586634 RepID=A0AAV8YGQ4_9CUCU|nr:hypothetical protein NQ314_008003 [Rhamnusium bicolor]
MEKPSEKPSNMTLKSKATRSVLSKTNIHKLLQSQINSANTSSNNSNIINCLGNLLSNLSMSSEERSQDGSSEGENQENERIKSEIESMVAMGLPVSFGTDQSCRNISRNNEEKHKR